MHKIVHITSNREPSLAVCQVLACLYEALLHFEKINGVTLVVFETEV